MVTAEQRIRSQFRQARSQISRASRDLASQRRASARQQQAINREESRLSGQTALRQIRGPAALLARRQEIANVQSQRSQVSAFQQQLSGVERQINEASRDLSRQERSAISLARAPTGVSFVLPGGQTATFAGGSPIGTIFSPEGVAVGTTTRGAIIGAQPSFTGGQSVPFTTPFGEGVDVPGFEAVGTTPSGGVIAQEIRPSIPSPIQGPIQQQQPQTLAQRERIRLRQIREAIARGDLPEAARIASAAGFDPLVTGVQVALDPFFESEFARSIRQRAAATVPGIAQAQQFFGAPVTEETLQAAGASIFFAPAFFQATAGSAVAGGGQVTAAERAAIIARNLARQRNLDIIAIRIRQIATTTRTSLSGSTVRSSLRNLIRKALQDNPRNGDAILRETFTRLGANAESRAILEEEISQFFAQFVQLAQPRQFATTTVTDIPTSGLGAGFPPLGPIGTQQIIEDQVFVSPRVTVPQFGVTPQTTAGILEVPLAFETTGQRGIVLPRILDIQAFAQAQIQQQQQLQTPRQVQIARQQQLFRQQQIARQAQIPGQVTVQIPRLAQQQAFAQIQIPRVPTAPRLRIGRTPLTLRVGLPGDAFAPTREALSRIQGGVNVIVGKGKKRKIVARNLPKNLALRTGVKRISKNITASFILRPSGKRTSRQDIGRFRPGPKFRPGKQDPLRIVEKRQFRLDSPSEISQIKKARKSKPKRRKAKR